MADEGAVGQPCSPAFIDDRRDRSEVARSNFQPDDKGQAVATGDFVLLASEVTPVLSALRQHGIEVTALHNHLADEQPRLFFMHFWGHASAAKLAEGLRAALDRMNLARPKA